MFTVMLLAVHSLHFNTNDSIGEKPTLYCIDNSMVSGLDEKMSLYIKKTIMYVYEISLLDVSGSAASFPGAKEPF